MSRTMFVEVILVRVISVIITIAVALILPFKLMAFTVIVLGQGHFLLAYWYQAEAGKLDGRKIALLSGGFSFLLWLVLLVPVSYYNFITGAGFLLHFALDEGRLLNKKHSVYTALEALPFMLIYGAMIAEGYLSLHILPYMAGLSVLAIICYVVLCVRNKRAPTTTSYAFFSWAVLSIILYFLAQKFVPGYAIMWFWGLILVHYLIWYAVYWFKLSERTEQKPQRTEYIWRVVALNLALVFLAVLYLLNVIPLLDLLFGVGAFNVWTLMHGFSSIRPKELRDLFRIQ